MERIFEPSSLDEVKRPIDSLKEGNTVTVELSSTPEEIGQRVLDLMSGAAYALNAKISRVNNWKYSYIPRDSE